MQQRWLTVHAEQSVGRPHEGFVELPLNRFPAIGEIECESLGAVRNAAVSDQSLRGIQCVVQLVALQIAAQLQVARKFQRR